MFGELLAGAALVSGFLGADAAEDAANAQVGASDRAEAGINRRFEQVRTDMAPYRDAGASALRRLMYLTGVGGTDGVGGRSLDAIRSELRSSGRFRVPGQRLERADPLQDLFSAIRTGDLSSIRPGEMFGGERGDYRLVGADSLDEKALDAEARRLYDAELKSIGDPEFGSLMRDFSLQDFAMDPGYQFRVSEGEKALQRGAVARGMAKSTPGLKSLLRFNQDMASQEYGAAFGRDQVNRGNKVNLLSSLAGMGQNAAAQTGAMGMNAATAGANAAIAGGAAMAQGAIGSASAWNNAIQGGLGNFMYQQRFDEMMKRMPVFGAPTVPTSFQGVGAVPY